MDISSHSKVDELLSGYVNDGKLAGVGAMILKDGEVAYWNNFGHRDLEAGKPMARDTIHRIYSMTKPVTCVAALMLMEEGLFSLDDSAFEIFPEFKDMKVLVETSETEHELVDQGVPMTLKQIFMHNAGFGYGLFPSSQVERMYAENRALNAEGTLDDMIERVVSMPLASQPGEKWSYSVSIDIVGKLVERLSGKDLRSFLIERIFEPLGMVDTDFFAPADKQDRLSKLYGLDDGGKLQIIPGILHDDRGPEVTFYSGGGGLVSTADDYSRFATMLMNGGSLDGVQILKPETVNLMTSNHLPEALQPLSFSVLKLPGTGSGLGVAVRVPGDFDNAHGVVNEYGWMGIGNTHWWNDPDHNVTAILLMQFMPLFMYPIHNELRALVNEVYGS